MENIIKLKKEKQLIKDIQEILNNKTTINDNNELLKTFTAQINTTKLLNEQGIKYTSFDNLLYYIQGLLFTLSTHNKNYTKKQEQLINTIKNILECVEV